MNWRPSRFLLGLLAAFAGLIALCYFCGWIFIPDLAEEPRTYPAEKLEATEELRDISWDRDHPPRLQREVDYGTGPAAAWWPRGESPILRAVVEAGELPPVAERVGPEPVVLAGPDGIGTYGGTWLRAANAVGDVGVISWRMSGSNLVRWSPMGYPIVPHLAKSWEASEDRRVWTFHLREGVRWSDGHPFTSRDILFWWEQSILYFGRTPPNWLLTRGIAPEIAAPDDHTVRFTFAHPYGLFLERVASVGEFHLPAHYLAQYHPETGDPAFLEAEMERRGVTTPRALFGDVQNHLNPECPQLWPWIYRTHKSNPPQSFVRNPYYWAVDPEGNQLPYVDRVQFDVRANNLIPRSASAGDLTMQTRHIRYEDYSLLMSQREAGDYQVYHWFPASRSVWTLFPNLNRTVPPGDPIAAWKRQLLNEKTFRQALSLAIDREAILAAEYNGVGEPAQLSTGRESIFFNENVHTAWIAYDPARARRMLDDLDLTGRDAEGFRTFPDGRTMVWYIDTTDFSGVGPGQFIVDYWADVGIRTVLRERSRPLFETERQARKHDFMVWTGESEFHPLVEARSFAPVSASHGVQAAGYAMWYANGGLYGLLETAPAGVIEPPDDHPLRRTLEIYEEAIQAPTIEEQARIFDEVFEIAAEHLWTINIGTPPPQLVIVRNGFRNVPENAIYGASYRTPANAGIELYYFEDPADPPGHRELVRREMTEVETAAYLSEGDGLGRLIRTAFILLAVVVCALLSLRHPFVARRLAIMVPTMLVISVIVFTIIQLPPGDFVQSRILQLQMTGDQAAIEETLELRELFHLDDPVVERYFSWLGLPWFFSFAPEDEGLLQGNMGRSMESSRPVNQIVGDRVLLTFLISLGTILFTWAVALPIGVYSAVRQYSAGDYIFTLIGFIGMCVPNFLLAILLMYWTDVFFGLSLSGLFSPEYAAQPKWTWGKVVDLLKHVWVPVVVLGTGGTAGMIRVMRGNLLDELRKPYVTTALAKGVRPMRLLIKYPVRIALNPFISGIGGIFPQLVSGGAIVAIVLSLPTVGPLMLSALMSEDMYLAGSMLMVLSLLGVLGTLVSDLLLLWLDPRIRYEKGSR